MMASTMDSWILLGFQIVGAMLMASIIVVLMEHLKLNLACRNRKQCLKLLLLDYLLVLQVTLKICIHTYLDLVLCICLAPVSEDMVYLFKCGFLHCLNPCGFTYLFYSSSFLMNLASSLVISFLVFRSLISVVVVIVSV